VSNHVVATAGHVDHGKSTLIRALTGIEPDRWAEERRRGLTIDLGFAWTTMPSGREVAFVDVPGHQRFLANTLAGLGPAPVVCFVVAADEGWQEQSSDHRDAVAALGIRHGVVVISRADRAPHRSAEVLAQSRAELADTGLCDAPGVVVSAVDGTGLDDLRIALDQVLAEVPAPVTQDRLRLWVDRSFTIAGSGTVVTGTLAAGTISRGDTLELLGPHGTRQVGVRGLQSRGESVPALGPVSRVALNLRGLAHEDVHRGDALLTPDAWPTGRTFDVHRITGSALRDAPGRLIVHVGSAAVLCALRPFGDDHARLTLDRALPVVIGDRLVLRNPGTRRVFGGIEVLDADPPILRRRGDGARRAQALSGMDTGGDLVGEVSRRGAVEERHLRRLGLLSEGQRHPHGVRELADWWIDECTYTQWQDRLKAAVQELRERNPLAPGLSRGSARNLLALPDEALLEPVIGDAGLEHAGGYIRMAGSTHTLGTAESAVATIEARLAAAPFRAPEAYELADLHLGTRELATAERAGRLLRLGDGVVLLPTAPALAMRELARLQQPFTTSQARQALDSSRRVVIPLLEYLDGRGWTRRLDAGHREVVR
jgi:selenocysteine-specific elongation factor